MEEGVAKGPESVVDTSRELRDEDEFSFSCTPERPCFTQCCYDLTLVLMPYDVLALKRALGISSTEFLRRYTSVHVGPESGVPVVTLRMEGPYLKCPFLEEGKGCTVYAARPGACRAYPLARMTRKREGGGEVEEVYYLVREPDCKGFHQGIRWTVKAWKDHEGLEKYNRFNDLFGGLLQAKKESGRGTLTADEIDIFYLGCYDMDGFRAYLLEGPNLDRYMESPELMERIKEDEEELLSYGISWVGRRLFKRGCPGCGIG